MVLEQFIKKEFMKRRRKNNNNLNTKIHNFFQKIRKINNLKGDLLNKIKKLSLIFFLLVFPLSINATDINTCQTITTPGYYRLTSDVSSPGTCFYLETTGNTWLDCNGHMISHSSSTSGVGVSILKAVGGGVGNFSVLNCVINSSSNSISSQGINFTYLDSYGWGGPITIFNNTINSTCHAIDFYLADVGPNLPSGNISYNTIYVSNGTGINGFGDSISNIHNNKITVNSNFGAYTIIGYFFNNSISALNNAIGISSNTFECMPNCWTVFPTFSNNNITSYNNYAVYAPEPPFSSTISFYNDLINSTNSDDFRFESYNIIGSTVLTNVSFDNMTFGNHFWKAYVKWYGYVRVVTPSGIPIANANVNVSNSRNTSIMYEYFNLTTNSSGYTDRINLTEYMQNYYGVYNFTPHYFIASKEGYGVNSTQFNISKSTDGVPVYTIVLGNLVSSCMTLDQPNNYYYLTDDIFTTSGTACITIAADNVTLDCQNHWINNTGNTFYGVLISGSVNASQAKVRNCKIGNFTTSELYTCASYGNFANLTLVGHDYASGLYLDGNGVTYRAYHNTFENLSITTSNAPAIRLINIINNSFNNISIQVLNGESSARAIFDNEANCDGCYNSFSNSFINSSYYGVYAAHYSGWNYLNLTNVNITGNNSYDVYMYILNGGTGHPYISLLNVTFNKSKVYVLNNSNPGEIQTQWYLHVHVIDSMNNDIPHAYVNIFTTQNRYLEWNVTTNATGWATANITEFIVNSSGSFNFTPHYIVATKNGLINSTTIPITDNTEVTLVLTSTSNVSSCTILNNPNTYYYLTNDIINSSATDYCIRIMADNITLDCQGHKIDGLNFGSSIGVWVDNVYGTTIYNCTISDWNIGIYNYDSDYTTIKYNTLTNDTERQTSGLRFDSSNNNIIVYNNSFINNLASSISATSGITRYLNASENFFYGYGRGVYSDGTGAINDSIFYHNTFYGGQFYLYGQNDTIDCAGALMDGSIANTNGNAENFLVPRNITFKNCIVQYNGRLGIDLDWGDYNLITNNTVSHMAQADSYAIIGVGKYSNVSYNTVINSTRGPYSICYSIDHFENSAFHNNNATDCYIGLNIIGPISNSTFYNNIITNTNTSIIFHGGSKGPIAIDNIFYNNFISNSNYYALVFVQNTFNTLWYDSTINSIPGAKDVLFNSSSNSVTFVNVSFNKSTIEFANTANNNLTVKWYADVHTIDNLGADIPFANVNISNTLNQNVLYEYFNETTNSTGWTNTRNITEFYADGTTYNLTPHQFIASKEGYFTNTTQSEVSNNLIFTIVLTEVSPINMTIDAPINGSIYYYNDSLTINVTAYSVNPLDSAITNDTNWAGVFSPTGNYFNLTNTTALSLGTHCVNVIVNDTLGVSNHSYVCFQILPTTGELINCANLTIPNSKYVMLNDFYTTGTCINISANNITLDCAGHKIYGDNIGFDYGILVYNWINQTTITNCFIQNFTTGISLLYSNWSNITTTTIFNSSTIGIRPYYSDNILVYNNNISYIRLLGNGIYSTGTTNSNFSYNKFDYDDGGLSMDGNSNYNIIQNNNFSNSPYSGISILASHNNRFIDNSLYRINSDAIYSTSSNSNTFQNMLIYAEYDYGAHNALTFDKSNNTNFINLTISNYSVGYRTIGTSQNNIFVDSMFDLPETTPFSLNYGSNVISINTTFDKTKTIIGINGINNLTVKWYADVHTIDNLGADIPFANVNISNTLNQNVLYEYFNETTNSTGWTNTRNITEYFQNNSGIYNFTPHLFIGSKTSYITNSTNYQITSSGHYTLVLPVNVAPTIIQVNPIPPQTPVSCGLKTIPETIFLVYDENGYLDILNASAYANFSNGTKTYQTTSCTTTYVNETTVRFNCSGINFDYKDSPGTWNILAFVSDQSGLTATNNTQSMTYNTLVSMTATQQIIFGTCGPGSTNCVNINSPPFNLTNCGNVALNTSITGMDISDGLGHVLAINNFRVDDDPQPNGGDTGNNPEMVLTTNAQAYNKPILVGESWNLWYFLNVPTSQYQSTYNIGYWIWTPSQT